VKNFNPPFSLRYFGSKALRVPGGNLYRYFSKKRIEF